MPDLLAIPGIVTKIGTTRDKSFVITFETQDKSTLNPSEKAKLMDLLNEYVTAAFKPTEKGKVDLELLDIPDITPEFKGDKSPSQRLRAVLWVLHSQTKSPEDFEAYYRRQVERIIDSVKAKLN
jgi:hypothetical protein